MTDPANIHSDPLTLVRYVRAAAKRNGVDPDLLAKRSGEGVNTTYALAPWIVALLCEAQTDLDACVRIALPSNGLARLAEIDAADPSGKAGLVAFRAMEDAAE